MLISMLRIPMTVASPLQRENAPEKLTRAQRDSPPSPGLRKEMSNLPLDFSQKYET